MTNMVSEWWHPDRFAMNHPHLLVRAKVLAAIRGYFAGEGVVEVDTPALQICPGMEPHIATFATDYVTPQGETHRLHLCTSPEFTCKKLLVAGMEKIYQLAHVFRNGESSHRHSPEFMQLEWYRVGAGYDALITDCEALLRAALAVNGKTTCTYQGISCDVSLPGERLSVSEAFARYTGIDLLAMMDDAENPSPGALRAAARQLGLHVAEDDRFDDIALRILGEKIEPFLGAGRPCFLYDYPLCMAALSRVSPHNPKLAERFELYVCGLELANAFVELTDATIQRRRFVADMALREERYGTTIPIDESFLAALEHGMPEAAGIALGVDRLVMLAAGTQNIHAVLWAPVAYTSYAA